MHWKFPKSFPAKPPYRQIYSGVNCITAWSKTGMYGNTALEEEKVIKFDVVQSRTSLPEKYVCSVILSSLLI